MAGRPVLANTLFFCALKAPCSVQKARGGASSAVVCGMRRKSWRCITSEYRAACGWGPGEYLSVDELDDVGVAAQALQQRNLVDEPRSRLMIAPRQPDALQRKYFAAGRHHLQ